METRIEIDSTHEWLLMDILAACKGLIDILRFMQTTFKVHDIVKWYTMFYCFVWKDLQPKDTDFESAIYHLMMINKFVLFPLNIKERCSG